MYAELSPVLLSLEMFIVTSSANLTSNAVPLIRVRPPPDLVTCTSNQVGAAFDGVGCAVFQNVVCAHVGPPLCCKGVGAVGVGNDGGCGGKGEGGANAIGIRIFR